MIGEVNGKGGTCCGASAWTIRGGCALTTIVLASSCTITGIGGDYSSGSMSTIEQCSWAVAPFGKWVVRVHFTVTHTPQFNWPFSKNRATESCWVLSTLVFNFFQFPLRIFNSAVQISAVHLWTLRGTSMCRGTAAVLGTLHFLAVLLWNWFYLAWDGEETEAGKMKVAGRTSPSQFWYVQISLQLISLLLTCALDFQVAAGPLTRSFQPVPSSKLWCISWMSQPRRPSSSS